MPNEETVPNKPKWESTQLAVVDRSGYTISANDPRWEIGAQGKLFWTALVREKAYADLFAAAPDLYKACELALNAFEKGWAIDWNELKKALAKARGEA